MFRIVTTYRNGSTRPVVERGPWHDSREHVEHWANLLRQAGYSVEIEGRDENKAPADDNSDLMDALASMA